MHVVSRREVPLPMRRKRSSMMTHAPNGGSHRSALLDDDALGRSPRSVAAKARYAYLVQQITGGDTIGDAITFYPGTCHFQFKGHEDELRCCCAKPLVLKIDLTKPSSISEQVIWRCTEQEFSAVAMDMGYL